MTTRTLIDRFRNGLWYENPGLVQLLGLCPLLAVTSTFVNGLGLGIATLAVLVVSNGLVSSARRWIRREIRIPIYVLKSNTVVQMQSILTSLYVLDAHPQDQAMRELEEAINLVRNESKPVELTPQNAYLRKLQHRAAAEALRRTERPVRPRRGSRRRAGSRGGSCDNGRDQRHHRAPGHGSRSRCRVRTGRLRTPSPRSAGPRPGNRRSAGGSWSRCPRTPGRPRPAWRQNTWTRKNTPGPARTVPIRRRRTTSW